ncbi:hypothetical protein GCM10009555_076030 [Acrocarpospora macrocephala]|uniref:Uncharacterized protein n=2 Tax=Acrocarpospora TaxID=90974 RepID=A0A5M3XN19_9ACTN|nr:MULTISPECIES: hypothetical protein [Acrocarpospora]GES12773.1 hypothetical protein Amac_063700 [Acrocarpospora macrocephala]GES22634.1 hypothetical protein Aple_055320 [Acrocarpospora pleiomorpha]
MDILIALGFVAVVLVVADRLLLLLESHGHLNWRRSGRKKLPAEPGVGLEHLLEEPVREGR